MRRSPITAVLGFVLFAVLLVVTWPVGLGGRAAWIVVTGHSMDPTYRDGDLLWAFAGEPGVGDVVVYAPEELDGARVVHRLVERTDQGWIALGDNNARVDPWPVLDEHILAIVRARLPIGVAGAILRDSIWAPIGLLCLAAALAIWPREDAHAAEQ